MKKLTIGFVCGIGVAFATGAAASSTIQANLFPSIIKFYTDQGVAQINGEKSPILMYNERTYVPLRAFAETMGATVSYVPPADTEGALPHIDVYSKPLNFSEKDLIYTDNDHYVNVGLIEHTSKLGIYKGVVKVNKDLTDKILQIELLDASGNPTITSEYVYIHQQDTHSPRAGDIRSFEFYINNPVEVPYSSVKVTVLDTLQASNLLEISPDFGNPFAILSGPPANYDFQPGKYGDRTGFVGTIPRGNIVPLSFWISNVAKSDVVVDPFQLEITVGKINSDNTETIIYQKKLPIISGQWESKKSYHAQVPWNLTDGKGQPLDYGTYKISIVPPETITYKEKGSTEVKTYKPFVRYNDFYATID